MFTFLKSKPTLKDLIPDDFIDIHSHLLPGIDDGASTLDDTLALVKAMQDLGVSEITTTPHIIQYVWDNTKDGILKQEAITVKKVRENGFELPFKAAAEYLMDDQFVTLFKAGTLLTLKDNYVLVEMSYINAPIQLYTILFDLQVAGYIPILAHPERYLFYHNNLGEYDKLLRAGCIFQLNLLSIVGYYGEGVAKIANTLLQKGKYTYVGTDVHHLRHIEAFGHKVTLKDTTSLQEAIRNNQFFKSNSL